MLKTKSTNYKKISINRHKLFLIAIYLIVGGLICLVLGSFAPDENYPERFLIRTNPYYCNELNSYFNRTESTENEDGQNKLIENYQVNGYVIVPKKDPPPTGYPVIIWLHGFSVSSDFQINYPRQFAKSGFLAVAIDQPGHGSSGGLWDMGITTILGIYSTIDWLINSSTYKEIIDKSRIGVSGHSMGGIAATQAALYDKIINPKTGNRVGTKLIKSACAVYCWGDLGIMSERLMQDFLNIEDVWHQSDITELLFRWRWFSNHDPSILENEIYIRSPAKNINISSIDNYCLIMGEKDELITIDQVVNFMSNSTKDESGMPIVSSSEIMNNISNSQNHSWNYQIQKNSKNYRRRLVIVSGIEHILEGFSRRVCQNATYWFYETMNCSILGTINPNVPEFFQFRPLVKLLGWLLLLMGSLFAIFPSFSYVFARAFVEESTQHKGLLTMNNQRGDELNQTKSKASNVAAIKQNSKNLKNRLIEKMRNKSLWFLVLGCILTFPLGFLQLNSITHFWLFDLIVPKFLLIGCVLLPFSLIFYLVNLKNQKGNDSQNPIRSILSNFRSNFRLKQALLKSMLCIAIILLWILTFDLIAYINQIPFIFPRPLWGESYNILGDFLILFTIIFLFTYSIEIIFRGSLKPQLSSNTINKIKNHAEIKSDTNKRSKIRLRVQLSLANKIAILNYIKSGIYSGIFSGIILATNLVIDFFGIFLNSPFIIITIYIAFIFLFSILGTINAYIFDKSKSIFATSIFQAFFLSLLISGKLFMNYA
ncbi:MAG: alpha/beta hydrolase family protein [Promethearchaeota archaeon]